MKERETKEVTTGMAVFNVITYAAVFFAIQIACVATAMAAMRLFAGHFPQSTKTGALIVAMAVSAVITYTVFILARWAQVSPRYLRSRPWAVFFWSGVAALGAIIPSLFAEELMPELPNLSENTFEMVLGNRWGYFIIGLLVPATEELVFRGAVLRQLLQIVKNHWVAIALSALIFSLAHANPVQMPHAFVTGLLLGWMYCRTGSILPGVVYHWVNNSVAYLLYNLYPDPSITIVHIFGGERNTVMAVVFSMLILLPALYQLYIRMVRPEANVVN